MSEMTWRDLAREYFPTASDTELDDVLWEFTAFPCAPREIVEEQLVDCSWSDASSSCGIAEVKD